MNQFVLHMKILSPRIPWKADWRYNLFLGGYLLSKVDGGLMASCFVLTIVAATLFGFLLQQMWFVSVNKTQVELDKIDALRASWKKEGITRKYVHAYGHGLVQNWMEFLFPAEPRRTVPRDYTAEWEAQEKKEKEKPDEKAKETSTAKRKRKKRE
jgi:hypothetical protein